LGAGGANWSQVRQSSSLWVKALTAHQSVNCLEEDKVRTHNSAYRPSFINLARMFGKTEL
jgi:hypothetical protein